MLPAATLRSTVTFGKRLFGLYVRPEPPVTCCGNGCANCVWLEYFDKVEAYEKQVGAKQRSSNERIAEV